MVQVEFKKSPNGKSIILSLRGHAGQAKEGQDIVCSATSILAYTVAQTVAIMGDHGKLYKKPTIRLDKGDILVVCKPRERSFAEAMHTYAVAQVGFALLETTYPDHVRLTPFETGTQP